MSTSPTLESALQRIAELEAENARLKRVASFSMNMGPGISATGLSQSGTIAGIEELVLSVDIDGRIRFLNRQMAGFLGVPDRKAAMGTALAQYDRTLLGEGFFCGIADGVRGLPEPWVVERECAGLDPDRLPAPHGRKRPLTEPILRIVASAKGDSVTIVVQDVTEMSWLQRNFARYVSHGVLMRMYQLHEEDYLTSERREISVLFGDLRGFTLMASRMQPEQVHKIVNSFLAGMVDVARSFDATINQFAGDAIMLLFNAPLHCPDHALRALVCAAAMQQRHATWIEERSAHGDPAPQMGVGVATGPVVIGNVGTSERLEYTAIGHTVNLASRLCSDAAGGDILTVLPSYQLARDTMSSRSTTLQRVPHLKFEQIGKRAYKNVPDAVEVIRVSAE